MLLPRDTPIRMAVAVLLTRYGLDLALTAPQEVIPGSYWGETEAGLQGNRLYARLDTPRALDPARDQSLHLHDAGAPRRPRPRCGRG